MRRHFLLTVCCAAGLSWSPPARAEGPPQKPARVADLIAKLQTKNEEVRLQAALDLGKIGAPATAAATSTPALSSARPRTAGTGSS